ncbi:MAG: hypothetical protein JNN08_02270 [Bryobacterales bacterium]|nr:hypothetical protein [Bryobacterales bacterium]
MTSRKQSEALQPLSGIYAEMGLELPEMEFVTPEGVPEPYRSLLVHKRDMTPTLEKACGGRLHLRVIRCAVNGGVMSRMVVLEMDGSRKPVEVGAIRIHLYRLPEEARTPVLELHDPFGAILRDHAIEHTSRPTAYFEITPDALIAEALGSNGVKKLYGRHNTIRDGEGRVLAEVVEILPPGEQS